MKRHYFLFAILIATAICLCIIHNKVVVHEQIRLDQESELQCPY
jgi:hypothetical protein